MDPVSSAFPGFYTTDDNTVTDEPSSSWICHRSPARSTVARNVSDYQIVIAT